MLNNFLAFSATEVGYNHIKANKLCEDYSDYYDDEKMHICVVADGHGSDNYPRTDKGAKFAVESAISCTVDFVNVASAGDVLSDEKNGFPIMFQLAKSILMAWHEAIERDYRDNPFSEEELKNVSEKYRNYYVSSKEEERNIKKAYGCTLILYVISENYTFGMQIGDGKCVLITDEGDFIEPIPWDENCQLNVTTSICDSNSIDEFRFYVSDKYPAAVFCGSDGIDDSYSNSDELYALYRSILKIFAENGEDVGKSEIKEYLPILTKRGSGDDVSIGLIIDEKKIKSLLPKLDIQAELFSLNGKLKEKKHQLDVNIENDRSLRNRITKGLASGKRNLDSEKEDFQKVDELCLSNNQLEGEITELENRITELEKQLSYPNDVIVLEEQKQVNISIKGDDIPLQSEEDDNKDIIENEDTQLSQNRALAVEFQSTSDKNGVFEKIIIADVSDEDDNSKQEIENASLETASISQEEA